MANWYVDYELGNNANAGTSFATALATISGANPGKGVVQGDVIRVKASPYPTNMGQNAEWTLGSSEVRLASAVTEHIDQGEAAWTAAANATATTNGARKEGASSASFSPGAAFTTGKIAHKQLPAILDLSSYQQISCWLQHSVGASVILSGDLSICLCTDTAGATPVHTFNIPLIGYSSSWTRFTYDSGVPLSTGIASIALYGNRDFGAATILIDNIIACKASSGVDSLTHRSLISKNNGQYESWYAIRSISGTKVILEGATTNTSFPAPQYNGRTETTTLYKREAIKRPPLISSNSPDSGNWVSSSGNVVGGVATYLTIQGGWNRTDMSTLDGETWFDGQMGLGANITLAGRSLISVNKICSVNYGYGLYSINVSSGIIIKDCAFNNNVSNGILLSNTGASSGEISNVFVNGNSSDGINLQSPMQTAPIMASGFLIGDGNAGSFLINPSLKCVNSSTIDMIRLGNSGRIAIVQASGCTIKNIELNRSSDGIYITSAHNANIQNILMVSGDSAGGVAQALNIPAAASVGIINNITGLYCGGTTAGVNIANNNTYIDNVFMSGGVSSAPGILISSTGNYINNCYVGYGVGQGCNFTGAKNTINNITANKNNGIGISVAAANNQINNVIECKLNVTCGLTSTSAGHQLIVGTANISNNPIGIISAGMGGTINSLYCSGNITSNVNLTNNNLIINEYAGFSPTGTHFAITTFEGLKVLNGSGVGGTSLITLTTASAKINNFAITSGTGFTGVIGAAATAYSNAKLSMHKYGRAANDHRVFCDGGIIESEQGIFHGTSGISWQINPTSTNRDGVYPLDMVIATIPLAANLPATISAWFRRSNIALAAYLQIKGDQVPGIVSDQTAYMSAIADTWELLSLSVTPTENGVIEVRAGAFGGTAYNLYVDDFNVVQ